MEFNRNHYFMIGLVLLVFGIQFKFVDSYVLSEDAAKFVAKRMGKKETAPAAVTRSIFQPFVAAGAVAPSPAQRSWQPPAWLGWSLISVGAVLILHALAMGRPGGGGE